MALRMSGTRLTTPVDVSLWTTITALMRWPRSSVSLASMVSGLAPCRQSPGMRSTSTLNLPASARHSMAKCPVSAISTLSPGDSVLTMAASQAPVPDEG